MDGLSLWFAFVYYGYNSLIMNVYCRYVHRIKSSFVFCSIFFYQIDNNTRKSLFYLKRKMGILSRWISIFLLLIAVKDIYLLYETVSFRGNDRDASNHRESSGEIIRSRGNWLIPIMRCNSNIRTADSISCYLGFSPDSQCRLDYTAMDSLDVRFSNDIFFLDELSTDNVSM